VLRLPQIVPESRMRAQLYRSFSWPLAKRLRTDLQVRVVGGNTMRVRTDDAVGRALAVSGTWEPNVTSIFIRDLSPGDVCLDVGAHIGYYTLLASKLVGATGHVYAFEPSPVNYRSLSGNLARNNVANVTASNVAVGASSGQAILHEGPGTNTGRATVTPISDDDASADRRDVIVDVRPIEEIVSKDDLPRIRLVKIDVEGSELDVLRSLEPVLAAGQPITLLLEFTAGWSDDAHAGAYVEELCRRHGLARYRLMTGYTLRHFFPSELDEPFEIDSIPHDQCDLLLTR